ncbi:hypothetical protein LOK49_LG03G00019 [Camellia lanceoleosa]|uniref:Uncharacterized protein n=1 Tax=Camellia lanceoleosa TaxID=1840588 RepID=A0ACC0I6Y7_9ERIC|nr:hypothetical protein LOK49_LG03G00019 [Camellia lanceoleosa]
MKPLLSIVFLFSLFFIVCSQNIQPSSTFLASNLNQSWPSPNNTFSVGFIANDSAYFAAVTYDDIPISKVGGDSDATDSSASSSSSSSSPTLPAATSHPPPLTT